MFEDPSNWNIAGGLAIGCVFGLIVRQFRFCLVNTVANVSLIRDYRLAIAFAASVLIAITGTQLIEIYGIADIGKASYRDTRLDWLGVTLGGFMFGIGATMAGGDAARVIVMAGNGQRAGMVAVFFFAVMAAVAQFGILDTPRVYSLTHTSIQLSQADAGLASLLSAPKWVVLVVVDALLIGFIAWKWKQHADIKLILAGTMIGLCVVAAWYISGVLAVDEFGEAKAPSGITVSGPMSRFGYLLVANKHPIFSLAVSFVTGVFVISLLVSLATRSFAFTQIKDSPLKVALGGSLMGIGGTLAYGCNIGQAYTGLSTLSLESIIAVIAMLAGIHLTTTYMEKRA